MRSLEESRAAVVFNGFPRKRRGRGGGGRCGSALLPWCYRWHRHIVCVLCPCRACWPWRWRISRERMRGSLSRRTRSHWCSGCGIFVGVGRTGHEVNIWRL